VDVQLTGVATGIGSLPGDDIDAALALVFDELPELPHLPELPDRGPGADLIGRTAAQLVDLPIDLQPAGWRLVDREGGDRRAARELLSADLDALLPVAGAGYDGALKVQLAGPWTLAAMLELPRGGRALRDAGAVRDIAGSLAEAVREHLAEVARRAPGAGLVLQLDEPALPAVLAGRIPTASGLGTFASPEDSQLTDLLGQVVTAAGAAPVVIHCCAETPPVRLLRAAGATAVSIDPALGVDRDAIGELVESGGKLWLGSVPAIGPGVPPSAGDIAEPVRRLWRELGFDPEQLPATVAVTPTCGLAGASMGWAHSAYRLARQAARVLAEAPEGTRR
jgi:methionine synthase II (cobalamin-independent)